MYIYKDTRKRPEISLMDSFRDYPEACIIEGFL